MRRLLRKTPRLRLPSASTSRYLSKDRKIFCLVGSTQLKVLMLTQPILTSSKMRLVTLSKCFPTTELKIRIAVIKSRLFSTMMKTLDVKITTITVQARNL